MGSNVPDRLRCLKGDLPINEFSGAPEALHLDGQQGMFRLCQIGILRKSASAAARALSRIAVSLSRATLRLGRPACLMPKKSPGPRVSRSFSARKKPSLLSSMKCSRCRLTSVGSSKEGYSRTCLGRGPRDPETGVAGPGRIFRPPRSGSPWVGDIDAHLHDSRGNQDIVRPRFECGHGLFFSSALRRPWSKPRRCWGTPLAVGAGTRSRAALVSLFSDSSTKGQIMNAWRLLDLGTDEGIDPLATALVAPPPWLLLPLGGNSSRTEISRFAIDGLAACAGWVWRSWPAVWLESGAFGSQRAPLLHAEAMLLIHNDEAQLARTGQPVWIRACVPITTWHSPLATLCRTASFSNSVRLPTSKAHETPRLSRRPAIV